jgi:hypothetical protein
VRRVGGSQRLYVKGGHGSKINPKREKTGGRRPAGSAARPG